MKRLQTATTPNGKAVLEVIECQCGYHMGIDGTYVDEHPEAFFDIEVECPSCKYPIPVRALLGMEPIKVAIPVTRVAYAHSDIIVTAHHIDEAKFLAEQKAADTEMREKESEYETDGSWYMPE